LGADVGALPVFRCWIMVFEEDIEQILIVDFVWIVNYLDGFDSACFVGADLFVGEIVVSLPV